MNLLFKISIILLAGALGGKAARLVKLPNVSGYLVAGLLIGSSFFNYISADDIATLNIISELALAMIAFSIGNEFILKDMLKYGKSIFIITLAEVVGAVTIVFSVMYFILNQSFAFSIVIASMSAATAPAATLLVMKQYNANGPLTKTILPVVALDDVFGIMAFGIAMALAKLSVGGIGFSAFDMIVKPLYEIMGSLLLGFLLGLILTLVSKKVEGRDEQQIISLAAIGAATGLSVFLGLSPLLTCIMMGATLANLWKSCKCAFSSVEDFSAPVYLLFFTLAGASLELNILAKVGLIGIAYIFARGGGKMLGAWVGAKSVRSSKTVSRYLGLALLPQGGISIGLLVLVRQQLPELSVAISTIIMFSVMVYEISGPIFAKIAIQKAGEINGKAPTPAPDEQNETAIESGALEYVLDKT